MHGNYQAKRGLLWPPIYFYFRRWRTFMSLRFALKFFGLFEKCHQSSRSAPMAGGRCHVVYANSAIWLLDGEREYSGWAWAWLSLSLWVRRCKCAVTKFIINQYPKKICGYLFRFVIEKCTNFINLFYENLLTVSYILKFTLLIWCIKNNNTHNGTRTLFVNFDKVSV